MKAMEKHILIAKILYQNKRYAIFSNKNHQFSFLEILKDNTYQYPSLEVFLKLNSIYNIKDISIMRSSQSHFREELMFEPKVFSFNKDGKKVLIKVTVLLLMLGLLTGCKNNKKGDNETDLITYETEENEYDDFSKEVQDKLKILKANGCNCDVIDDEYIYVKENFNDHTKYIYSNKEFKEYLKEKNPTFKDLKKALEQNENIPTSFKTWISEYLNVVEEKDPNRDLSIFYYNLSNLRIISESLDEIHSKQGQNTFAYFSAKEYAIYVPSDNTSYVKSSVKSAFMHELSHLWDNAYIMVDGNDIHKRTSLILIDLDEDLNYSISYIGGGLREGLTDLTALKYYPQYDFESIGYYQLDDLSQLICDFIDSTYTSMSEDGIIKTIELLKAKGIDDPLYLLQTMDVYCETILDDSNIVLETNMRESVYKIFLETLTNEAIKNNEPIEDVYKTAVDFLNTSIEQNISNHSFASMSMFNSSQSELLDNCISYVTDILKENGYDTNINTYDEAINLCNSETKDESVDHNDNKEEQNDVQDFESNLFVYYSVNHEIKLCYAEKDQFDKMKYYKIPGFSLINESEVLYGEFLTVLKNQGIVSANLDKINQNEVSLEINYDKWDAYFNTSSKDSIKDNNNLSHNSQDNYENLYVYAYEENNEKHYGTAYAVEEGNETIFYDKTTNKPIERSIIGGEYFSVLKEQNIIMIKENGTIYIDFDRFLEYISEKNKEQQNDGQNMESDLFVYYSANHEIKICYAIKDKFDKVKYYKFPDFSLINESDVLYGEFLTVLKNQSIVNFEKVDQNQFSLELDYEKWFAYFNISAKDSIKDNNHLSQNNDNYENLYVYAYEENNEKHYGTAYVVEDGNKTIFYDTATNKPTERSIIGGEYFSVLKEQNIIMVHENGTMNIDFDKFLEYVSNNKTRELH